VEQREIPLFSSALLEHFRTQFSGAWLEQRNPEPEPHEIEAGEKQFRQNVLGLPARLGELRAKELNRKDEAAAAIEAADGTALIAMASEGLYSPDPADTEWELIDRSVDQRSSSDAVDGAAFARGGDHLSEGMEIVFGPGIHALDERRLRGEDQSTLPSDITVSGAGMNSTLLSIGDISIRQNVTRLAFRDLTLDAQNDGLFDMRSGSLVLDLQRVRIVRFDAGHGGCNIFSSRGAMIRATDSEIVGGYGSYPGGGYLTRGSPILARFSNCHFEFLDLSLDYIGKGRVIFDRCSFSLLNRDPRQRHDSRVTLLGCTFGELLDPNTPRSELQKQLSDLFWGFGR
jgi:hypothetical protein